MIYDSISFPGGIGKALVLAGLMSCLHPVLGDSAAAQSLDDETRRELAEIVAATLDSVPVAGMAVGVVVGDSLVYARGFGLADLMSGAPVTPGTLFQVGSVSKSFTATVGALLAAGGVLRLDDRLDRHLPGAQLPDSLITLRQLAAHTSGLPRDAPGLRRRHDDYPVLAFTHFELYRGLAESEPSSEPGAEWSYSNFGYGVLGHALERATGLPYEVLVEREVFEPLGMSSSTVTIWPELAGRLATPYYVEADRLVEYTPWDPEALSPASGIASTLRDMGRYVAFQIREGRAGGAVGELQSVRIPVNPELRYGLGWFVEELPGVGTVVSVGGDLDGYVAEIAFSPAHEIGTIVLANTDPAGPLQHLGRWLLASLRAAESAKAAREARFRRAMIHQGLGEWSSAVRGFAELTDGPGPHLPSLYQLGRTGALSGEHLDAAERALTRYLAAEPLPAIPREAARWRLGMVYEHMGRCPDAERQYRVAAEAAYAPAREALAALACTP